MSARALLRRLRRLLRRVHDPWTQGARTLLAAVGAWAVAADGLHSHLPVLAPIAALLTMQSTVYTTVRQGTAVCAGVVIGAAAGLGIGHLVGGGWAAVVLATAAGLVLRELPCLGGSSGLQIAISALLVVTLGNGYGYARVLDTAVGGAVGILVSALLLPPVRGRYAANALADLAEQLGEILRDAAASLAEEWELSAARAWLSRARDLEQALADVRARLSESERSMRWNPRAPRHSDYLPQLRAAASALDHVASQVRSITRNLADAASDEAHEPVDPPSLPAAYQDVLSCCAAALLGYAGVLRGEDSREELEQARSGGLDAAGRATDAVELAGPGSRTARLVAPLLEDPRRLLDEIAADGPHAAAYDWGDAWAGA